MELVVYLQDEQDLAIIESLLNRLKLRFEKRNGSTPNPQPELDREKNLQELRSLSAQIKDSTFGDPLTWQEETRKERPLPLYPQYP